MTGPLHILVRGAAAVIVSLGAAAGCGPAARDSDPPFNDSTVVVSLENGTQLAVGRNEVTWQDWKRCHDAGACRFLPKPAIHGATESFPVVGINYLDISEFIAWANAGGERRYRLPTAAEWEAIAAALPKPESSKLFDDPRLAWAADYGQMQSIPREVRPSGRYGSLPNGIQDLGGSVFEWTSTCAVGETDDERCPAYIVQGLHKAVISVFIRDPAVGGCSSGTPPPHIGFRVVSEIEPLQS